MSPPEGSLRLLFFQHPPPNFFLLHFRYSGRFSSALHTQSACQCRYEFGLSCPYSLEMYTVSSEFLLFVKKALATNKSLHSQP